MESSRFRQCYDEFKNQPLLNESSGKTCYAMSGREEEKDLFIYWGRAMSLEVYLSVPTFIRRGLSITR